ncbi:chondroitin sulfate synthase 1-like [Sycon ciliatum]|uniref:chondroitin sulfate synthase 1-like n=1 Tax=Sycon ciliatum TaxID=27933 RepID=UPI0031F5F21D
MAKPLVLLSGSSHCLAQSRTLVPRQWRGGVGMLSLGVLAGMLCGSLLLLVQSPSDSGTAQRCSNGVFHGGSPERQQADGGLVSFLELENEGNKLQKEEEKGNGLTDLEQKENGKAMRKGQDDWDDTDDLSQRARTSPPAAALAGEAACVSSVPSALPSDYDMYRSALPDSVRPLHLVLIGVMTTAKFVDTRAVAGYRTWGRHFDHLVYFSSEGTESKYGLPVVGLNGIDDEYPPQRKAFAMLRYFAVHFSDTYSFFVRLDDDVYVRTSRLQRVLSMLNREADLYIGQPGEGNKKEKKTLGVQTWRYCMGGPGVVYSRSVLKKLRSHVDYCLRYLMQSTHEDVEVGRCLHERLGISCSWNAEMAKLFFHGFSNSMIYSNQVHSKHLRYAVTIHPLKDPKLVYKLHHFYLSKEILLKENELALMNTSVVDLVPFLKQATIEDLAKQEIERRRQANDRTLQLPWLSAYRSARFSPKHVMAHFTPYIYRSARAPSLPQNDFRGGPYRSSLKMTLGKMVYQRSRANRKVRFHYTRLNEGFMAYDPVLGYRLVADSQISEHRRDTGVHDRTEQIEVYQRFNSLMYSKERSSVLSSTELVTIVVVVSAARAERFDGFVDSINSLLEEPGVVRKRVRLFVTLCLLQTKSASLPAAKVKQAKEQVRSGLAHLAELQPKLTVRRSTYPGRMSAEFALRTMRDSYNISWWSDLNAASDDLVLIVDESVRFRAGLLQRCRLNAVSRTSVYFPIVFSVYPESVSRRRTPFTYAFTSSAGTWLDDYYGVGCFHARDLNVTAKVFGLAPLWEEEELATLASDVVSQGLDSMRAPDPDVYREHVHLSTCDRIRESKLRYHCSWQTSNRIGTKQQLLNWLGANNHEEIKENWLAIANSQRDLYEHDPLAVL